MKTLFLRVLTVAAVLLVSASVAVPAAQAASDRQYAYDNWVDGGKSLSSPSGKTLGGKGYITGHCRAIGGVFELRTQGDSSGWIYGSATTITNGMTTYYHEAVPYSRSKCGWRIPAQDSGHLQFTVSCWQRIT